MRITKLPIPLLLAAAALTSVVYIYVHLTAPPMPIHTDPNFTGTLYAGGTYLWRGAAYQYVFSADSHISMSYGAPYHLMYLFGPLYNISLGGGKIIIVYGADIRPLYAVKQTVTIEGSTYTDNVCLIFKLQDVTPQNSTIANLTLYLPVTFDLNDVLTNKEERTIYYFGGCYTMRRVIQIQANSTHIIFQSATPHMTTPSERWVMKLESLAPGKTITVTNQPVSGSYAIGGATFAVMALPYLHFTITPQDTTTLTIYVS